MTPNENDPIKLCRTKLTTQQYHPACTLLTCLQMEKRILSRHGVFVLCVRVCVCLPLLMLNFRNLNGLILKPSMTQSFLI